MYDEGLLYIISLLYVYVESLYWSNYIMFEEHHNDMDNTTILDALLTEENYVIDSLYDSYMTNVKFILTKRCDIR